MAPKKKKLSNSDHYEATVASNKKYLEDTGKSEFNFSSGEGDKHNQTQAGVELAKKSKTYFFTKPGRNRAKHMADATHASFLSEPKPDKPKRERKGSQGPRGIIPSGDIKISRRREEFETSLQPRLENIQEEYKAAKGAPTVIVTPK